MASPQIDLELDFVIDKHMWWLVNDHFPTLELHSIKGCQCKRIHELFLFFKKNRDKSRLK